MLLMWNNWQICNASFFGVVASARNQQPGSVLQCFHEICYLEVPLLMLFAKWNEIKLNPTKLENRFQDSGTTQLSTVRDDIQIIGTEFPSILKLIRVKSLKCLSPLNGTEIPAYMSVCLSCLSVCLVCLSVFLHRALQWLSLSWPHHHWHWASLSLSIYVHIYVCLSVCLHIMCLSVCMSVCGLSVCLSVESSGAMVFVPTAVPRHWAPLPAFQATGSSKTLDRSNDRSSSRRHTQYGKRCNHHKPQLNLEILNFKGIVPHFFLLTTKSDILDGNGVWYCSFWSEGSKTQPLNLTILVPYFVPRGTLNGSAHGTSNGGAEGPWFVTSITSSVKLLSLR